MKSFVKILSYIFIFLIGGCNEKSTQIHSYELNGSKVKVELESLSLCVDPRHIEPEDLMTYRSKGKALTAEHYVRRSVPLAFFSKNLDGYTDLQYEEVVASISKKSNNPSNWIRAELLRRDDYFLNKVVKTSDFLEFEKSWVLDEGFQTQAIKSNNPFCAEPGNKSSINCVSTSLRSNHPNSPEVILKCFSGYRCYVQNVIHVGETLMYYDFPEAYLPNWSEIHNNLINKIKIWQKDKSCFSSS